MNGNVVIPATGEAQHSDAPRSSSSSGTLRFLVCDEDPHYLKVSGDMLDRSQYEVMRCIKLDTAKDMLEQNRGRFDILLCNTAVVNDIDRLKFLKGVSNDTDISVALMWADEAQMTIRCIFCGSCDNLNGPIKREVLGYMWHRIHRRGGCTSRDSGQIRNPDIDGSGQLQRPFEDSNHTSSKSETKLKRSRNEEEENNGEHDPTPPSKKQRLWDGPRQQIFLWAINQLGGINSRDAVPSKILELMKVNFPWLTRDHVASHLQKERERHKQLRGKETQKRVGESHELPRDENSRNINMASGPQQHPMIAGNGGQVIFSDGPPPRPLLPQPDFLISSSSLLQSEESSVGFNFWEGLEGVPGNVVGMDFNGFQHENTIPQHTHENIVSNLDLLLYNIDNPEWATNFSNRATGRHLNM